MLTGEAQSHAAVLVTAALRDHAAAGTLRQAASAPGECAGLRAAAFELAMPLVWERHTRPLENAKGHRGCASGMIRLAPECHDGFTDDLESVVTALLSYRSPIGNVEGWISARMANAIKDGYRVRRAREMGAQQRVRVPAKVAARLDNDPWLIALAERVLQWAGIRRTACPELWPLGAWAEERTAFAGLVTQEPRTAVADDVAVVLQAMHDSDPAWFDRYVEKPIGRKWAPVAAVSPRADGVDYPDTECLELVPEHERYESHLTEAAARSLTMIRGELAAGTDARKAVTGALTANFMSIRAVRGELDRAPGTDHAGDLIAAVLGDRSALDRLVPDVLTIVRPAASSGGGGAAVDQP